MKKIWDIKFKSMKSGKMHERRGELKGEYNNPGSDRWVLLLEDGSLEDIYKATVKEMKVVEEEV
jgi:hypothetical protein